MTPGDISITVYSLLQAYSSLGTVAMASDVAVGSIEKIPLELLHIIFTLLVTPHHVELNSL